MYVICVIYGCYELDRPATRPGTWAVGYGNMADRPWRMTYDMLQFAPPPPRPSAASCGARTRHHHTYTCSIAPDLCVVGLFYCPRYARTCLGMVGCVLHTPVPTPHESQWHCRVYASSYNYNLQSQTQAMGFIQRTIRLALFLYFLLLLLTSGCCCSVCSCVVCYTLSTPI
jgi:hypothetical protein